MLAAQAETIETTAWSLLRALKERALLARELAGLAGDHNEQDAKARLEQISAQAAQQAEAVTNTFFFKNPE